MNLASKIGKSIGKVFSSTQLIGIIMFRVQFNEYLMLWKQLSVSISH